MIRLSKLLLGVAIYLLAACSENSSEEYDNWHAVNESGSIKRGWIPSWLPREGTNIKERHNIDTNALALSFEVLEQNFELRGVTCEKILNAPKPRISLNGFPANPQEMDNLKVCGGYYVLQSGRTFYLWKNDS